MSVSTPICNSTLGHTQNSAQALIELQSKGAKDIFIACVDGLKSFSKAIATVHPQTQIYLCIVYMVRNAMRFVGCKKHKIVTIAFKAINQIQTQKASRNDLEEIAAKWDYKYPNISKSCMRNWKNLNTNFFIPHKS